MDGQFAGATAEAYAHHRRDVPGEMLDQLVAHLGLTATDRAIDLGAGTGQVAVGLAARLGGVLALDPEPDMLVQLRRRLAAGGTVNVVCALAADHDLPGLAGVVGTNWGLLTVANALHWMDAAAVFSTARQLLRPGGGIAVITHGTPLWLGEQDWQRALRALLERRFGPAPGTCGTDAEALAERRALLSRAGFSDVEVLHHRYAAPVDADHVLGNLASAMSPGQLPPERRRELEDDVRTALAPHAGSMVEEAPVTVLVGRS
ncbi:class I SAM-dependent methyltransferase [Modestobacter sp. SYSU DS0511]